MKRRKIHVWLLDNDAKRLMDGWMDGKMFDGSYCKATLMLVRSGGVLN